METWWENTEDTTLWGEVDDFEEEANFFSCRLILWIAEWLVVGAGSDVIITECEW